MIIDFPTALYNSVLPQNPEDNASVTLTISSTNPPRDTGNVSQLPIAEKLKPLPDKIFDRSQNRDALGDFVFSISQSFITDIGTNKKQFEVGELLSFGEESDVEAIGITEVPDLVDLQQNTNLLDLSEFGLSDEEVESLTSQAEDKFNELIIELNAIKSNVKDNEVKISENQKSLNEARKAIKAVRVVLGIPEDDTGDGILQKLLESAEDLLEERDALVSDTNSLNAQAKDKFQELLDTRQLVR